jgi:allantoinase
MTLRSRRLDHPYVVEEPYRRHSARASWWGGSVAVSFVLLLEYLDDEPEDSGEPSVGLGGGPGPRPHPDYAKFSHREYGHRVGVFRLLDLFERHGISPAVAIDAATAQAYPALMSRLSGRPLEVIAHGTAVTRMITSAMTLEAERTYVRDSIAELAQHFPHPRGWLGPEYGESVNTPRVLIEQGIEFLCDWGNDEHPFRLFDVAGRGVWVVPSAVGYDDSLAIEHRKMSATAYFSMVESGVRQLLAEARESGQRRSLVLNLRPYLTGQPFRSSHLDDLLTALRAEEGLWFATPSQLVDELAVEAGTDEHGAEDGRPRDIGPDA